MSNDQQEQAGPVPYHGKYWKRNVVSASKCNDRRKWEQYEIDDYGMYLTQERLDELLTLQDGRCTYCSTVLQYGAGMNRKTNPNALTVERVDNNVPHVIENCLLACSSCNRWRGVFYTHDEFKEHYANIRLRLIKKCRGACTGMKSTALFHKQANGHRSKCRECLKAHLRTRREARAAAAAPY